MRHILDRPGMNSTIRNVLAKTGAVRQGLIDVLIAEKATIMGDARLRKRLNNPSISRERYRISSLRYIVPALTTLMICLLAFGCGARTPNYEIVAKPTEMAQVSYGYPVSGAATVDTDARNNAEMKALCVSVAQELSRQYPNYNAILINVKSRATPNPELLETMAYFQDQRAKREYLNTYGEGYGISCYP